MISKLLDEGYAYESGGNIYFDTSKYPNGDVFYTLICTCGPLSFTN